MEEKVLSTAVLQHAANEVMTHESFSRSLMQHILNEAAAALGKQERPAAMSGPLTVELRATVQRRPGGDGCIIVCIPGVGCFTKCPPRPHPM